MINETTKTQRILMAVVAIIGGLYLMLLAPTQAMQTLKICPRSGACCASCHMMQISILLCQYFRSLSRHGSLLLYFAGALLLMLAKKLYEGVKWARAVALGLFAIPSVAGITMMIPWFVLVLAEYPEKGVPQHTISGMPPALPILFIDLLFYFIILLADQDTLKNKALKLVPFTALGHRFGHGLYERTARRPLLHPHPWRVRHRRQWTGCRQPHPASLHLRAGTLHHQPRPFGLENL